MWIYITTKIRLHPNWNFEFFKFSNVRFNLISHESNLTNLAQNNIFYLRREKLPKIWGKTHYLEF